MKFTVTIDCDNHAFTEGYAAEETARILVKLADKLSTDITFFEEINDTVLLDIDGNAVGRVRVEGEQP